MLASVVTGPSEIYRKILCTKTRQWDKEQEIRFIGKTRNVNLALENPVKSITIDNKVSSRKVEELIALCNQQEITIKHA